MLKKISAILLFGLPVLVSVPVNAQQINISTYNGQAVQSVVFSPMEGTYKMFADSQFISYIKKGDILYLSMKDDQIRLRNIKERIGFFSTVHFKGVQRTNTLKVKPVTPSEEYRMYAGNFAIENKYNRLLMINKVDFVQYTAGVVEAECGPTRELEFYKAMAVIARTYALKHLHKHASEGFHVCDQVHCQVYKGLPLDNTVLEATQLTRGEILLNGDTNLITAAFHSNCGGETANSETVWLISQPYLRSVQDPYCKTQPHARWEEKIPVPKWKNYLAKNGFPVQNIKNRQLDFEQEHRKQYYTINNDSLLLRTIRKDWSFPSTFFEIDKSWGTLTFEGRGYGHGVGLCQEGAMIMAQQDHSYKKIIQFYYQDVSIEPFFQLSNHLPE